MNIKLWLIIACGIIFWTACPLQAEAAAGSDANTVKCYLDEAKKMAQEQKYDEALKYLEKVLAIEPNNQEALNEQFAAFTYSHRPDDALKVIDKLISLDPNDHNRLLLKFFYLAGLNRHQEALKVNAELMRLQPEAAHHYMGRAQCLEPLGRYDEALAAMETMTTMDPNRSDAWGFKGYLQYKLKQYDAAIASFTKAIALATSEEKGRLLYNRACLYALKGDKTNALTDLKLAIEAAPNFKEQAKKDEEFKALQDDPNFKKLTE